MTPTAAVPVPFAPGPVSFPFVVALHFFNLLLFALLSLPPFFLLGIPIQHTILMIYVMEVVAVFTHALGHTRVFPAWFRAHTIGHHTQDYPSNRFLQTKYVPASIDNSNFYIPGIACVAFLSGLLFVRNGGKEGYYEVAVAAAVSLLPVGGVMVIADKLHQSYHVAGSRFERIWGFDRLRSIHFWHHHRDCKRNYGIASFWLDFLLFELRLI
jgi:hypothetical protein